MRAVFVGASSLTAATVRQLVGDGHEVVVIERDGERIEQLKDDLDCGFIEGDGTRPAVLKQADPHNTDFLFCFGNADQDNIIAALVGRAMDFKRVVPKIEDPDFEGICTELGLDDTMLPDREVARTLAEIVKGRESAGLQAMVKKGVRFFTFTASARDAGPLEKLALPDGVQVVAVSRDDTTTLPDSSSKLQEGDEVLLILRDEKIDEVRKHVESGKNAAPPAVGADE